MSARVLTRMGFGAWAAPTHVQAAAQLAPTIPGDEEEDEQEEGTKRGVTRAIEKNKGLTRKRKKIDRNARTKNREKFRRAVIRRKGQVQDVVAAAPRAYAGELTGIKKNVTHSRRFA